MKKPLLKLIACIMVMSLVATSPYFPSLADEYDDQIEAMKGNEAKTQETISNLEKQTQQTREAIAMLKDQREATQGNVNSLQKQSNSLKSTIDDYSNQLDDLDAEIRDAEEALSDVSSEIVSLDQELEEIRRQRDERYELLKKRLRSVYESGGTRGLAMLIFESGSFSDFFSRTEYFSAVVEYDQNKMAECRALEEELQKKLDAVHEKESQLNAYQDDLDNKFDALEDLTNEVMGELASTNSSLSSESQKMENYDEQLKALDKTMKSLEAQTAAAQAELARQMAARLALKRENTGGSYAASASELEWLAATIQAEADGESYTGKLAVGSVIMNRVKSSAFPNTVIGVITQNMQFASYRSGKVELIIARGPNSTCVKAAQEVLDGARVGDYLFFMTKYYADYYGIAEYTMIGNHAFFYSWTVKKPESQPAEEQPKEEKPQEEQPQQQEEQPQEEQPQQEEQPAEEPQEEQPAEEPQGE